MVDLVAEIITFTIYGIFVGFLSHYLALGFDSMMDYGGILDWIRWNKFCKYAKRIGKGHLILEADNPTIVGDSEVSIGTQIADWRHKYYLIVSAYSKSFKLWICTECMSIRISILFNCIAAFCIAWNDINILRMFYIVPMSLTSVAFIYFIINYDR